MLVTVYTLILSHERQHHTVALSTKSTRVPKYLSWCWIGSTQKVDSVFA